MSLINKVLRDLDRRNAPVAGDSIAPKVRVVERKRAGHEWFWRMVAVLMLAALSWVGWVVYQVQPQPITTELAEKAEEEGRLRQATQPPKTAAPKPPVQAQARVEPKVEAGPSPQSPAASSEPKPAEPMAPVPAPAAPSPGPLAAAPAPAAPPAAAAAPSEPPTTMRFAYSIETPIGAPASKAAAPKSAPRQAEKKEAPAVVARATPPADPRVVRKDRELTGAERADTEFRRGADLLKRGRSTEAEAAFVGALRADAGHQGARQALAALKLERGQLDEAARLLQEGLVVDPGQTDFAVALARIHVERGRLPAALEVLDDAGRSAGNHAEFQSLRGTVLQRLGRHADAAQAYRTALTVQPAAPYAWMGLGISLEALQQKPEAAQAFRNALAAGSVSSELRTFAEQRIQALR